MINQQETSPRLTNGIKIYQDINLQIIIGITLMAVLGSSSIGPTLPSLAEDFNVSPQHIGWIITAFVIPIAIGTPISGILADRYGRKQILVPGLLLFAVAGTICALAPNFRTLIEFRFIQGVGAAPLESLALTLISDIYRGKLLTAAMAFNATSIGLSLALYPLISGGLTAWGWRYPFLLPLLAIPLSFLVLFVLRVPQVSPSERFELSNYLGNIWRSINNHQVMGLLMAVVALFILLFGPYFTYIPLLADAELGASHFVIGIILASMALSLAFVSSQLGLFARSLSEVTLIKASFIVYAIALIITPTIHQVWLLFIPSMLFGLAHGMVFPATQALLGELAPQEYRAGFMAVNATVLSLGQALGPILAGGMFTIWGMSGVFYSSSIFALVILIFLSFLLMKQSSLPR
ncbi:MFS transporter [Crocosphaera sp.]|uniref:MFS transporter n=1 Tax=Crocosphaera sp. TaxID=2729996 RepID=UPI003F2266DB